MAGNDRENWEIGNLGPFKSLSWPKFLSVHHVLSTFWTAFFCTSNVYLGKNASSELLRWGWGGILDTGGCTAVNFGDPSWCFKTESSRQSLSGQQEMSFVHND